MTIKKYYRILNISPQASDDDVRRAWRMLALRWHPDRNPGNRALAQHMFIQINRAYTVLKTRPQREAYNRRLLSSRPRAPESSASRRFLRNMKEIFWPFAMKGASRHG